MLLAAILTLAWRPEGIAETELQKMRGGVVQSKKELGGLQKKIQKEKERIQEIRNQEASAITQLNALDQNLVRKKNELKSLDRELAGVTLKVQKANSDLGGLTQNISAQEALLNQRLVALYKFGDIGIPEILFAAHSYQDVLNSQHYLILVAEQDRRLIEDYRQRQTSVGRIREQWQKDERELQELRKKTDQKKAEIQGDLSRKSRLLDAVRDEKRIHLAAVQDLETASAHLQELINRLEKEIRLKAKEEIFVPAGKGFASFRGKLPFPVAGSILSTFGKNENPKFNTFSVQKGIEIEASPGTEIRAVFPGRVLYADWFKGYGKILIIDHGNGYYTLSGHASTLMKKVGDEVHAGEVIALVGDTGSLKGPCLYFEIRQRGKPLDPLEWLASVKAS